MNDHDVANYSVTGFSVCFRHRETEDEIVVSNTDDLFCQFHEHVISKLGYEGYVSGSDSDSYSDNDDNDDNEKVKNIIKVGLENDSTGKVEKKNKTTNKKSATKAKKTTKPVKKTTKTKKPRKTASEKKATVAEKKAAQLKRNQDLNESLGHPKNHSLRWKIDDEEVLHDISKGGNLERVATDLGRGVAATYSRFLKVRNEKIKSIDPESEFYICTRNGPAIKFDDSIVHIPDEVDIDILDQESRDSIVQDFRDDGPLSNEDKTYKNANWTASKAPLYYIPISLGRSKTHVLNYHLGR